MLALDKNKRLPSATAHLTWRMRHAEKHLIGDAGRQFGRADTDEVVSGGHGLLEERYALVLDGGDEHRAVEVLGMRSLFTVAFGLLGTRFGG